MYCMYYKYFIMCMLVQSLIGSRVLYVLQVFYYVYACSVLNRLTYCMYYKYFIMCMLVQSLIGSRIVCTTSIL